jgi:hypothetical protein
VISRRAVRYHRFEVMPANVPGGASTISNSTRAQLPHRSAITILHNRSEETARPDALNWRYSCVSF